MTDSARVWQQVDTAIQEFLVLEVSVGMTFADSATRAHSTKEGLHNRKMARRAYDTGMRWRTRARFTQQDTKVYDRKLRELRLALNRLGDPIQDSYYDELAL